MTIAGTIVFWIYIVSIVVGMWKLVGGVEGEYRSAADRVAAISIGVAFSVVVVLVISGVL